MFYTSLSVQYFNDGLFAAWFERMQQSVGNTDVSWLFVLKGFIGCTLE